MLLPDPTLEDMLSYLVDRWNLGPTLEDRFEAHEAIYWFAAQWHGGQSSNLYSALCCCGFDPGPISRGPKDGAQDMYEDLEARFVHPPEYRTQR